jgi:hypothetical protein
VRQAVVVRETLHAHGRRDLPRFVLREYTAVHDAADPAALWVPQ